jgi:hypothetical protein
MNFLNALMNTDPSHLLLAAGAVIALCGMAAGGTSDEADEDDNSDYDNASWNPSSVNYNG